MAEPQPGLFAQGLTSHFHVEFVLKPGASTANIRDAITRARQVSTWLPGPNVSWGFSPALWDRMLPGTRPDEVQPFEEVSGVTGLVAPSTQYDIWAWCSSGRPESVASTAASIVDALAQVADLTVELPAYTTFDSRDPTGFIDGTENPAVDEAYEIAIYPEGSTGAGGSAVLIQKWVHKMAAFEALPVDEQEGVIGRTKEASIELPDSQMPATSHVSRNTVLDADGEERHIFRRNTQFDLGDEVGTQFIGLTNDTELMLEMLNRMFGATSDGLIDRLAEFSDAVTGSMYFAPSMDALTEAFGPLKPEDDEDEDEPTDDPEALPTDGHLRIGSLK